MIHLKLSLGAFIVVALAFTSFYEDASFALLRPAREEAVRAVVSGKAPETAPGWPGQHTLPQRFPRLACCNNTVVVLEDGVAVLFPITGAGANSRAYLYDPETRHTSFRTIADYGGGWRLVETIVEVSLRPSPP